MPERKREREYINKKGRERGKNETCKREEAKKYGIGRVPSLCKPQQGISGLLLLLVYTLMHGSIYKMQCTQ